MGASAMPRQPSHSLPSPSEPNLRRLSHRSAERPLRAQLVVASVLALIVVAVPLYLLRRPRVTTHAEDVSDPQAGFGGVVRPPPDSSQPPGDVELSPVQRVKCSPSPRQPGNEGGLCDPLPELEMALRRGIRQTPACAPRTGDGGTINYVLEVDFNKKRVNVFPGQSGKWKGPQARRAAKCVQSSLPPVTWDSIPHQYRYYALAVLATYPTPDPLEVLPDFD